MGGALEMSSYGMQITIVLDQAAKNQIAHSCIDLLSTTVQTPLYLPFRFLHSVSLPYQNPE